MEQFRKAVENECVGKISHFLIIVPKPTENLRKCLKKFWRNFWESKKISEKIWEIFLPRKSYKLNYNLNNMYFIYEHRWMTTIWGTTLQVCGPEWAALFRHSLGKTERNYHKNIIYYIKENQVCLYFPIWWMYKNNKYNATLFIR